MAIVPIYLSIDDKTYAGVTAGALELCGMAKKIDNKRVIKHIPAVTDAAKESASKAIDFIREHKKGTVVVGGVLIIGGAVVGTISYVSHWKQRELEKQFAVALQSYIDVARDGKLTIEDIEKNNPSKSVDLHISA